MSRELTIGATRIADETDAFVIAEIGHNHQGHVAHARDLVSQAAACGAAAVKLQKRDNRSLFTPELFNAPYESEHSFGPTYGEHREALELDADAHRELMALGRTLGVDVFATVFDVASADAMAALDVPAFKIASGDLTNVPLLEYVATLGKPVILSTGGGSIEDVDRAVEAILPRNASLAVLQCTACYPAEPESMNLSVITTLRERYPELVIGLSDHHHDGSLATVAYALGARVIEKHFTLDRSLRGSDHGLSLEPAEFREMVAALRRTRLALGDGVKRPDAREQDALLKMSKKLTAAQALPAGHLLSRDDIAVQSPGDGLAPWQIESLIGRALRQDVAAGETITFELVAPEIAGGRTSRSGR